jgi:hypothetical protein
MFRFSRKAKTPLVKGVGEDREVAVGTTYVDGAQTVTVRVLSGDRRGPVRSQPS